MQTCGYRDSGKGTGRQEVARAATSYIRGTAYGVTPSNFTHSPIDARAQRRYSPTKICQLIEQTSPMPSCTGRMFSRYAGVDCPSSCMSPN